MQFDFDSAMGYGPNQKFTSAGDAVVPSLTPRVSGFSQYPFNMQSAGSAFDKAAYDLPLKPLYEISGDGGGSSSSLVPGLSGSGSGAYAPMPFDSIPQMQQQPGNRRILTSSQHSELEMARRRAEKAAEGKRANAEAAKQRFKRKKGERAEAARLEPEERQGNEEIEHKLSVVEDQKEAKRLKRLLRNRVSAQQARERKKSYVSTIEEKVHDQDSQLAQLRQRVQTLERENGMLRQVIKNIKGSNKDAMLVPSAKPYQDTARVPVFGES
ncbi:hypothetical protein WJX77_001853 [Trebouxia sp. C0004]